MPELPEVESARSLIAERALGREIVAVDDHDTYVCRPHAPGELAEALTGARLTAACRRGKAMWCVTDQGPVLGLHLGMAGRILVDDASAGDPVRYSPITGRGNPVWARFRLDFADGGRLVLFDKRRLGRAVLDPDLSGLGPDALDISRDAFRARVGRGEAPLKARIMDQAVLAGVGNLLADEALWQARLPPLRPAGSLSDGDLDALRRVLRRATRRAIARGGVHTGDVIEHRCAAAPARAAGPRWSARPSAAARPGGCSAEQAWPPG
jgi:formamidopyrimidine-DNA glycosylase